MGAWFTESPWQSFSGPCSPVYQGQAPSCQAHPGKRTVSGCCTFGKYILPFLCCLRAKVSTTRKAGGLNQEKRTVVLPCITHSEFPEAKGSLLGCIIIRPKMSH